jgi:tetratricopeptide (TPR) repeat protein
MIIKYNMSERSLAINPNYVFAIDTKALILNELGRYQEAVEWYDKVLEKDPKFITSINNKGVALANLGYYQQALNWYDKALKQVPGDLDMIANKARILGIEQDKYTDALKLINSYLKKNPDHKGLLCNKEEILDKMGYKDNALSIKKKLIELYSDNYKCGYFKKTSFGNIAGEPFV